jgi:hypothetical protein
MSEFRFSRRTVIAAVEMLDRFTHAELTRFLLKLGPDFPRWAGTASIANRLNNLIGIVDQWPDRPLDGGELLRDVLVETAVGFLPTGPECDWQEPPSLRPNEAALLRVLELDGFAVSGGVLRRALPVDIELPAAENEVLVTAHLLLARLDAWGKA